MKLKNKPVYSLWNDLVFHTLSCLPVEAREAGNLYDPRYVAWWDRLFPAEAKEQRTLTTDAPMIAKMYQNAQQAFKLNIFALIFNEFDEFNATMETMFPDITFQEPLKQQMADSMVHSLPADLLEMFRIAMWSEAQSGFFDLHRQHVVPIYDAGIPELEEQFALLADHVNGLADTRFLVSHPLRRAGRLLFRHPVPQIAIGIPNGDLQVPAWAPAIQGCHEYILSKTLDRVNIRADHNPRVGSAGHYAHMAPEMISLSVEAHLLKDTLGAHYHQWLAGVLSSNCVQLADALPWEIKSEKIPQTDGVDTVADWLASGDAIPSELQPNFVSLCNELNPNN